MDEQATPEDHEPNDAEIAAAADREAKDAASRARADKKATPPVRRGPGRPPGAKNRKPGEADARARGAATKTAPPRKTTPRAALPAASSQPEDADRAARRAQREARKARVNELVNEAKEMRPDFVTGVGMLAGLPMEFLVQPRTSNNGQPVIDGETGEIVRDLTPYGQALAPKDWQLKMCCQTYVRVEETDIGARLTDAVDKWAPYLLMVGAVGAVGMYAFTTMQTASALRPMIAEEIQRMAAAQAAQQQAQQEHAAQQQEQQTAGQGSPAGERPAA